MSVIPVVPARTALLVVDVQNDFCTGGALPVRGSEAVVHALNGYLAACVDLGVSVYASRASHSPDSRHFRSNGGIWPDHCVRNTPGAAFHPALRLPTTAIVVTKGADRDSDGHSAFEGRTLDGIALLDDLRATGIDRLLVGGLATDYSVKHSVIDARGAGLGVRVLADAIAGVDERPGDSTQALADMQAQGAQLAQGALVHASGPEGASGG